MNARVDTDTDDDRGKRRRDRAEAWVEERGQRRRPERSDGERREHAGERAQAAERQREHEGGEHHRERAALLEIGAHERLRLASNDVTSGELERHVRPALLHTLRCAREGGPGLVGEAGRLS